MDVMEYLVPITRYDLDKLKPGEWIWDNQPIERRIHKKTLCDEKITEPIGFRQIDILDLELYPRWSSKPFVLSTIDSDYGRREWVYFEEGRFYRFKDKEVK